MGWLKKAANKVKSKVKSTVNKVVDTVKKNPLKALAAVALGPIGGAVGIGKSLVLDKLLKGTSIGNKLDDLKEDLFKNPLTTIKDLLKNPKKAAAELAALQKLNDEKSAAAAKVLAKALKDEQLRSKESVAVNKFTQNRFDRQFSYEVPFEKVPKPATDLQEDIIVPEPIPIPTPMPTPAELAMYRKYTNRGIYWKSNNKYVMERDNNGNIIIDLGDDITKPVIINDQLQPIVRTIPAPNSGHLKIPINVNIKITERTKSLKRKDKLLQRSKRLLIENNGIGY